MDIKQLWRDLGEPSRRAIIDCLRFGPKSVLQIASETGFKQPNVSNHLAKLKQAGLVRAEKVGRQVFYSIARTEIYSLLEFDDRVEGVEPDAVGDLSHASEAYVKAMLAADEDQARRVVDKLLKEQTSMIDIYEHVFEPGLWRLGEWYSMGVIDEAQEHLGTHMTERMMSRVVQHYAPLVPATRTAVFGCVAGNWHEVGTRMVSDVLRLLGWRSLHLGANVPTDSFVRLVEANRPELVGISCALPELEHETRTLINRLKMARERDSELNFAIALGGHFVHTHEERALQLGADIVARNLREVANAIGGAHFGSPPNSPVQNREWRTYQEP